jgi:hypothetical protein
MWFVDDRQRTLVVSQQRPGCWRGCLGVGCTSLLAALMAVALVVFGIAILTAVLT